MTRRLHAPALLFSRSRRASLAAVVTLSSASLLVAVPAMADVVVDGVRGFAVQCEADGFSIAVNGMITLDAGDTATSYLRVNGVIPESIETYQSKADDFVVEAVATTALIRGAETHFAEWIVNDEVRAQQEFSFLTECVKGTPSPVPTESPVPTPTPTEKPTPTQTPDVSPPVPVPSPSESLVPSTAPKPSASPVPTQAPAPVPTEQVTAAPVSAKPVVRLSSSTVPAATSVTVFASGFVANEKLALWLHSDPWKLMDVKADANGELSVSVGIAGGTDVGEHQIEVRGAKSGSAWADLTVTNDLAITGIDSAFASGVATTGLVMVIGGIVVVLLARRAQMQAGT